MPNVVRLPAYFVAAALALAPACTARLNLGSDLLWVARHETGDLSEWSGDDKGGASTAMADTSVKISTDYAHSGKYAVKLSNAAVSMPDKEDARLWRSDRYPQAAYYTAWYYLPRGYETTNEWTIMQLRVPSGADGGGVSLLLDVDLRSLPGGDLILSVYDHRPQYLRAATPDPEVKVPVGSWFQVQAFFDYSSGPDGRFVLWQDGHLLYDLHRPFNLPDGVYFSVCNYISVALSPPDSAIYVDDASVSLTRVALDAAL